MTPATTGDGKPVILTSEEVAYLRKVLAACLRMLTWADRHGGPQARTVLADLTRQLADGRSPGGLAYDLSLAIDYLDFAPVARSDR